MPLRVFLLAFACLFGLAAEARALFAEVSAPCVSVESADREAESDDTQPQLLEDDDVVDVDIAYAHPVSSPATHPARTSPQAPEVVRRLLRPPEP